MGFPSTTKIDINYFMFLYKHKHLAPRTISKSIFMIFKNINPQDTYLKFLLFLFFYDVCGEIKCSDDFVYLKDNLKLINFIKEKLFEDAIPGKHVVNLSFRNTKLRDAIRYKEITAKNSLVLVNFLLSLERSIPDLFFCDPEYFVFLNNMLDHSDKRLLLNQAQPFSPFFLNLLLSLQEIDVPKHLKEIYYFLISTDKNQIEGMKYLESKRIDHKKLGKELLYCENKNINVLYNNFLLLYPEIKYSSYTHPNRIGFFEHPLKISMEVKTLKVYLPAALEIIKINSPHLRNSPIDVLLKIIYIERILKKSPTKREFRLIHSFILDSSQVVTVLLGRKFDSVHIANMVKYVPSMFIAFDIALKMFIKSNCSFYLKLLNVLLKKYPTRDNFRKLSEHLTYFPPSFTMEFDRMIRASRKWG